MSLYYPPIIEGKIPACVKNADGSTVITVPYILNKAVGNNDYDSMYLLVKTVTTGTEKIRQKTNSCKILNTSTNMLTAAFTIEQTDANKLTIGNYYKVQVAFAKDDNIGPWSSIGIMKYTNKPTLVLQGLDAGIENINPTLFTGVYTIDNDPTEKIYSYNFTIKDNNDNIYDTSGDLVYDGSNNEIIDTQLKCSMSWMPTKTLDENKLYKIVLSTETINGYKVISAEYTITAENTVDARLPAKLLATPDYDNGCIELRLISTSTGDEEERFSGHFIISRQSKSNNAWYQVCRFSALSQTPSEIGVIWIDHTIEHGEQYLYAIQAYNSKGLHSNKKYHVLSNLDVYNKGDKYLELDEYGKPYYITADFEDMFLSDSKRQLKIRFNPKVSSYKPTILESKVDTLGSKYPFIFRNGNVNYKEFPISGLLSYLMDEKEMFMEGVYPPEEQLSRGKTKSAAAAIPDQGAKLTSDNFFRERQFKMAVLDWLTNGEPKLFRSPSEGNYIVRLMNSSLSPNETVGRMLHTFSSTAYEIAECNFANLEQYNLIAPSIKQNISLKLAEEKIGDYFNKGCNLYQVRITNASPGTEYEIALNSEAPNPLVSVTIGITGTYIMDNNVYPVISITKKNNGDVNGLATVHYGYYDETVPDNFSYISNITMKPEMAQIIGYDDTKNIIEDRLEDIRREVGVFYSVVIKPRAVLDIQKDGSTYKRGNTIITDWDETTIYRVNGIFYSGNPNNGIIISGNDLLNGMPKAYFKLNDLYILDLATNKAYAVTDTYPLGDPSREQLVNNPEAMKNFGPLTNGYYVVENFGNINSMKMSKGVYVDLAYRIKEIEYSIEEANEDIKNKKTIWLTKVEDFNKENSTVTEAEIQAAYNEYIAALEDGLNEAGFEEGYYAI